MIILTSNKHIRALTFLIMHIWT